MFYAEFTAGLSEKNKRNLQFSSRRRELVGDKHAGKVHRHIWSLILQLAATSFLVFITLQ